MYFAIIYVLRKNIIIIMIMIIIVVIIIIQAISISHNLYLRAKAQCAYRNMQNIYIYKNGRKKQTEHTGYLNYHTMDNHTIYNEKIAGLFISILQTDFKMTALIHRSKCPESTTAFEDTSRCQVNQPCFSTTALLALRWFG